MRDHYLQRCTEALYEWQAANRPADKPFLLHDGPPYANGSLHVGHALNKILKDIIIRVKVQQGHRVKYVPGWDCHGLPIELKALEAAGVDKSMTPVEIRSSARELASKTVLSQMKEFKSYAVMADWERRWTTMDPDFEIKQLELFLGLVQQGLIYRKFKPVYWSPSSGTALAEAELEYKDDHKSTAAYVRFPLLGNADTNGALHELLGENFNGQLFALIWTTTPWTLPANKAIAVHDDLEYAIIKHGKDALIVGAECLARVNKVCFGRLPEDDPGIITSCKGSDLRRFVYRNPLHGDDAAHQPILHADFVSADSGSGLVHMAPGHGHDDYDVCKSLGLDISAPVDNRGHFTSEAYPQDPQRLEGLFVQGKGNTKVLELLGDNALHVHKYQHKYPYDWRSKQPIIVRATAQWFADVAGIKDEALRALDDVQFIPPSGKTRLQSFIKGRSEWCISRQRAWGVPIPALYDKNGDAVMTEESVRHIISVIRERGTDAWWSDDPADPVWIPSSLQGQGEYRRGMDTMDVWFDSGTSWTQEGGARADVNLEGSDQHRGWFQSSLLTRVAAATASKYGTGSLIDQTVGLAPFKRLVTHGFTLDKNGKKMSKSLGNTLTPDEVMEGTLLPPLKKKKGKDAKAAEAGESQTAPQYDALGPDALRLWAASGDYTHDVVIGAPVLKSIHTSLIKYRGITKMLLGSMVESARTSPLTTLDHIAMIQLRDTMEEVGKANDNFEFYKAFNLLNRWVNTDLSSFYLEAMKDRLYCGDGGGIVEPIFWGFMRMLAPITPMLVEEAWDHTPEWLKGEGSVHPLQQLYSSPLMDESRLPGDEAQLRKAIPVLSAVHAGINTAAEQARRDKVLGSSLQCSVILQVPDPAVATILGQLGDELESIFVVSSVGVNTPLPEEPEWKYSLDLQIPIGGTSRIREAGLGDSNVDSSSATVGCTVWVLPPNAHKCPRCWRYVAPKEDALCGRCEDVVQTA